LPPGARELSFAGGRGIGKGIFTTRATMGRKGKKSKKALEDELQKQAEEQKRREEQERLQKLEEDCLTSHRTRLAAELEAKQRVEEAERLDRRVAS